MFDKRAANYHLCHLVGEPGGSESLRGFGDAAADQGVDGLLEPIEALTAGLYAVGFADGQLRGDRADR
jgi:hypothetical protein